MEGVTECDDRYAGGRVIYSHARPCVRRHRAYDAGGDPRRSIGAGGGADARGGALRYTSDGRSRLLSFLLIAQELIRVSCTCARSFDNRPSWEGTKGGKTQVPWGRSSPLATL